VVYSGGGKARPSPNQGLEGRAQEVDITSLDAGDGGRLRSGTGRPRGTGRPLLISSFGSPGSRGGTLSRHRYFHHSQGGGDSAAPPWAGLAASGFFLSPAKQGRGEL
jgi:hypothetical protein